LPHKSQEGKLLLYRIEGIFNIAKELSMNQIIIGSQAEYDNAVRTKRHFSNELILQETPGFITVHTDVTVGKNGRCKTEEDAPSSLKITAKENGILDANGKCTIFGSENANIVSKGNCKVTLTDSAFGNFYGHCQIVLRDKSKASIDGNCTANAYEESSVSASGSSKVYTNHNAQAKGTDVTSLVGKNSSILTGEKKCSITAKDDCIVYASGECSVQAADNCLIVADKNTKIKSYGNCLIMSKDASDISLLGQCEHINLDNINEKNIMGALKQIAQTKAAVDRPYIAIQVLKDSLPPARKEAVDRRLNTMGLKDQISAKNYLYGLVEAKPVNKNQAPPGNLENQLETARKAGYVQGVCECVAAVGEEKAMGKKLLTQMNVTKSMAKKYAPEAYKALNKGFFATKQEQSKEISHGAKR
jgi:hypothetical protein